MKFLKLGCWVAARVEEIQEEKVDFIVILFIFADALILFFCKSRFGLLVWEKKERNNSEK